MPEVVEVPTDRKYGRLTILKASEMKDTSVCMAIYGSPGVGKTFLAADANNSEYGKPMAFLSAEGGETTISDREDIDVIPAYEWRDVQAFVNQIKADPDVPWKAIAIDNMSEIQAMDQRAVAGSEPMQIQHHGKVTADLLALTRFFRDLSRTRGISVFLIAWESPEKDETTGAIKRDVGFTPSLARQFPGIVDMVGYLTVENNPPLYTRKLSFAPSPKTVSKFRRSRDARAQQIPYDIYYGIDDHPIVDLLATLRGGKPWPTSKYLLPRRQQQGQSS